MYCKKTMNVNVSASKFKHISKTYLLEFSLDVFYSKRCGYIYFTILSFTISAYVKCVSIRHCVDVNKYFILSL